ncbi:YdcF family protein [Luteibacter yeojuensis]|uniref:YdcF family protein n=1 Tax=Luteibacter yeojuensis TaxID=345309 RepID=A0A7X5QT81_9GAMM|nr:YdcF family protein [Luteibacter yeojuensis]NID14862.1 YdcF family protein [Luteibacter yeojuensis]
MIEVMDMAARLTHPAVQALLLGIVSLVLVVRRRPMAAAWSGAVALAWLWVASTPAVALALRDTLAAPAPDHPARADAIVVLGGETLPRIDWSQPTTRAGKGLALWRDGYAPLLLVSGRDQARTLAEGYAAAGVPMQDLRVDGSSRNTHENARNSATLLAASGASDILLVTSAIHMRRAAASFRKEGVNVSPVPASDAHAVLLLAPRWLPRRDALTLTARCLRERLALWVYHLRGWA